MKPTVTELIDLINKPALLNWANKIGLQGKSISEYKKQSLNDGLKLHDQIYNKHYKNIPFAEEVYNETWNEFVSDKRIIELEKNIETQYFIGRLDCILQYSGRIYLCDFKKSNGVYLENLLQLTAYRMAYKCDYVAIVQIPDFVFKPQYQIKDFTNYENILKSLYWLWVGLKKANYI